MIGGAIAVVVVLAIVLVTVAWTTNRAQHRYENYLGGLWTGNAGYLDRAQLQDFQLFIGPRESGGARQGYLIMVDLGGGFVANQSLEIRETPNYTSALRASLRSKSDVYTLHDVGFKTDDGAELPMPARLRLSLSILDGTLTLYDGKSVYAFLEKDLSASAVATEAYGPN